MKIVIFGVPEAKGRPRARFFNNNAVLYTPLATRKAEQRFREQLRKFDIQKTKNPLKITLRFYAIKPRSYPKRINQWTKRPDIDNLIKLALDAMNKIVYDDDSQVVSLVAEKHYGDVPRTEIIIEEI